MDVNVKRLLNEFKNPKTTNEAIQNIFKKDVRKGADFVIDQGWKYYVHLNKLVAPMQKWNMIEQVGTKMGPTNRQEKIWKVK